MSRRTKQILVIAGCIVLLLGFAGTRNLRRAIARARQKQTMHHIYHWARALDQFRAKTGAFPAVQTLDEALELVQPNYADSLDSHDGWGRPMAYVVLGLEGSGRGYMLASAGSDGRWENPELRPMPQEYFDDSCLRCDLVFARLPQDPERSGGTPSGNYLRKPRGLARW